MNGRHGNGEAPAKRRAWMSWSSGKDSALALHVARSSAHLDVVALLTTVNETHARVAMHAVRESLLEAQAAAVGLPLVKVPIPSPCPNGDLRAARRGSDGARPGRRSLRHGLRGSVPRGHPRLSREAARRGRDAPPLSALGSPDRRARARDDRRWHRRRPHLRRPAPAFSSVRRAPLRIGPSSPSCRQPRTPAERTENSTRSCAGGRCFERPSPSRPGRSSSATGSSSRMCF